MNEQETIADIIAEKRRQADEIERDCAEKTKRGEMVSDCYARELVADIRKEADRLDAALKRERGDCAKLRAALIKARSAICHFAKNQCASLSWEGSNIQANCGDVLCSWRGLCDAKTAINAALAAPPRNCEVGTAEEQMKRQYDTMCNTTKACPDPGLVMQEVFCRMGADALRGEGRRREVTKKEVVAALRKSFNSWASLLPDVEYKSCNNASEYYDDDANVNALHVLELAAEQTEEEGGMK